MIADRRMILTGAAGALVAAPAVVMAQGRHRMSRDPAAMPMPDVSGTRTHQQFEMGVIGPAQLSLVTSQIAVDRARKADAREFAGFELTEAIAVTTVLKQLGNSVPPMGREGPGHFGEDPFGAGRSGVRSRLHRRTVREPRLPTRSRDRLPRKLSG